MKKCKIDGCNNKHHAKGYCSKHYAQYLKYGNILERTIHDLNEIIEYDDYAEILLYNKDNMEVARALIDLEDIDLVKNHKWYLRNGYVYNNKVGALHRFLLNPKDDEVVDHINHCKSDNRRINLRVCSQQQNNMNKLKYKGSSQYKGVSWSEQNRKWCAHISIISINGKQKSLGYYDTELTASIEYDKAAILYYGVYAKLNHPIYNYYDYILDLGLNPSDFEIDCI